MTTSESTAQDALVCRVKSAITTLGPGAWIGEQLRLVAAFRRAALARGRPLPSMDATDALPSELPPSTVDYMPTAFDEQLDAVAHSIGDMCGFAGTAMQQATQALLDADIGLAETVISEHHSLVNQAAQTESDAFTLLALQAPVAADLRAVVSSLQNVADVDRMGALALHVAKTARRRHPVHAIPDDFSHDFAEMGRIAIDIGQDAKDVVLSGDPKKAAKLDDEDNAMDELHRHLFTVVIDRQWPHTVAIAVDVTLLSRYYERFADHAVEIGRRVIFQATGAPIS